jgi:hypothetical protein
MILFFNIYITYFIQFFKVFIALSIIDQQDTLFIIDQVTFSRREWVFRTLLSNLI